MKPERETDIEFQPRTEADNDALRRADKANREANENGEGQAEQGDAEGQVSQEVQ